MRIKAEAAEAEYRREEEEAVAAEEFAKRMLEAAEFAEELGWPFSCVVALKLSPSVL